jgi:hypothetical protein
MSLASLIRRMADAGASSEVIALAVEEIEALQSSLDARRAADRDRKRAQREREKSANVTGQSEDCRGTVTPISAAKVPSEVSPAPLPTNLQSISPRSLKRAAPQAERYHRMPEGWLPSKPPPPQVQAKLDQWPPGAEADELAAFKRWAANAENKNGKGRKLDWDKAWWNWIGRRHDERYSRNLGRTDSNPLHSAVSRIIGGAHG